MAISVNCATKVVSVPLADLTPISTGIYGLTVESLRLWLKDWEDSETGMAMPDTHRRNAPVTLSGATYAQTLEIVNGYTITFENGSYRVRMSGGNHNVADVMNPNSVSIEIGNSAGLIVVETGVSGLTAQESADLAAAAAGSDPSAVAAATVAALNATTIPVDVQKVNAQTVVGSGTTLDPWGPA